MIDGVFINSGTEVGVATDLVNQGGTDFNMQIIKLDAGGDGVSIPVEHDAPLPVSMMVGHPLTGRVDLTDTITQLNSYGTPIPCRWVRVKSILTNTKLVYVGNASFTVGVPTILGYELDPGESVIVPALTVQDVYAVMENGQTGTVVYLASVEDDGTTLWLDAQD